MRNRREEFVLGHGRLRELGARGALGGQQCLAFRFELLAAGDVAQRADDAARSPGGIGNGGGAVLRPAHAAIRAAELELELVHLAVAQHIGAERRLVIAPGRQQQLEELLRRGR